jgi:carbon-monoxide dehydrogenase large subunit
MIGRALKRVEDPRFLTGGARYVGDLTLPGMLHAAFVRSPHAHAGIRRVDLTPALALPGVIAGVTGEELARRVKPVRSTSRMKGYKATEFHPIAFGKVRYAGEAVAAVVAENRYLAEDAVERARVEYEPLLQIQDPEAAMEPASPLLHEEAGGNVLLSREFVQGDVERVFGEAAVVVRDRFRFHRHAGVAMENRACLAEWEPGPGTLTLWSSTQVPGLIRDALAELLGIPAHRIRVVAPDVGGGFGVKSALYPEELAVAALSIELGRPVKWTGDRREDLLTTTQAWDELIDAELALAADGTILGLRARVVADVGAYSIYPWTASIEPIQTISFLPGPYRIPNYRGQAFGVATNKAPMGPYRGVARPVSTFVTEGLIDRAARRLQMDPTGLRLKNFIRSEEFPYPSPSGVVWDCGSFAESLERARETVGYETLRAEQKKVRDGGRRLGVGFSSYVELTGVGSAIPVGPGMTLTTGTEAATVRVDPTGTVTAIFGLACHGQGHETTLAQVVAEELGVPIEAVRVIHGDTGASPYGSGTYASRSAVLGGGAAILASRALREKILRIAVHQLEVGMEDLSFGDGRVSVKGMPDRALSLREIAQAAYTGTKRLPQGMEPGLEATRFYDPYFGTASNATHAAVVEVDPESCQVRILRYAVVEDCGRVINPLIVEGQAAGGVVQGLGGALLEELVYSEDGQLLTGSLMDYLPPTAAEAPPVRVVHLEHPSPTTLGGFKGMGEGGTIGAPAAIANAVADALTSFGVELSELPLTPDRLFRLLRKSPAHG